MQLQKKHKIQHKLQKIKREDTGISLAKGCYSMNLELLTNATVVDDAIRFVNENRTRGHYMSTWMILGLDLQIK